MARRSVRLWSPTPGSTVAVRFSLSILKILFIFIVQRTMPPSQGTEPPLTFVPRPRGVRGIFSLCAILTKEATWPALVGNTTASGSRIQFVVPSYEYSLKAFFDVSTFSLPTIP